MHYFDPFAHLLILFGAASAFYPQSASGPCVVVAANICLVSVSAMTRSILCRARSLALLAFLVTPAVAVGGQSAAPAPAYRLDSGRIATLLGPVAEMIDDGRESEARAALGRHRAELTRRHGAQSLAEADYVMAFALATFSGASEELRNESPPLMEQVLAIYRQRLGSDDLDVALVLSDIGNGLLAISPDNPGDRALEALSEAHRLRAAGLGPRHAETLATLVTLARASGLPSRTRGEPERIAASATLFGGAIETYGNNVTQPGHLGSVTTRVALADMYLQNRRLDEANAAAQRAMQDLRENFAGNQALCAAIGFRVETMLRGIEEAGHGNRAKLLGRSFAQACPGFSDRIQRLDDLIDLLTPRPDR